MHTASWLSHFKTRCRRVFKVETLYHVECGVIAMVGNNQCRVQ